MLGEYHYMVLQMEDAHNMNKIDVILNTLGN